MEPLVDDFFLNRFYKDYYGTELPDSMSGFVGEGKPVTPEDMVVVTEGTDAALQKAAERSGGE